MHKHLTDFNAFVQHEHKHKYTCQRRKTKVSKIHPKLKELLAKRKREEKAIRRKFQRKFACVVNDLLVDAISKVIDISALTIRKLTTDKLYFLPLSTPNLIKLSKDDCDDSSGSDPSVDDTNVDEAHKDVIELGRLIFSILVCMCLHIFRVLSCFVLYCFYCIV